MKASDFIAKFLESRGVKHVFELSGGMITHILDSISQQSAIQIVTMHHEQAAAFAADAYARVTGIPGVALATSGPGATNLLTGIGSCYFDSVPAVFITGQVNRHEQKGDRNIRQLGFQETDIVSMAKPITKAAYTVMDENTLPEIFEEAFRIALEGRPGPVLIDIPMDIQRRNIECNDNTFLTKKDSKYIGSIEESLLSDIILSIQESKKPLILIGRGVRASFSTELLRVFAEKTNIPVVKSLLALDGIETTHHLNVGFIGSYGNRWANIALGECDLLIVIGSRLDIRQTGANTQYFEQRKIFHVDCEEGEINNRIKGCVPVIADVKVFLQIINRAIDKMAFQPKLMWQKYIEDLKNLWPDTKELASVKGINPNIFLKGISEHSYQETCGYVADVGAHQMWAAQSIRLAKNQLFLTSAGMGAMGYALPAAIGFCIASGKKPVTAIIGDGCMQINLQELQTIVRNKLPVKIIVMNNRCLGMIRQFQDSYFESRYQSTYWGYSAPDFEKVALAYGIKALTIENEELIDEAVGWIWNEENKDLPILLHVNIDSHTNTYPKIAFGKPITEMEPFAKPIDMEST